MDEKCILNAERDCLGLIKAKELEHDLNDLRKQNSSSHERIFERLGDLEKQEGIQGVQYENILEKLGDLTNNLNDLKTDSKEVVSKLPPLTHRVDSLEQLSTDVKEIQSKPGKRWESIVEKAILLVVSGVVGFVLAQVGLK